MFPDPSKKIVVDCRPFFDLRLSPEDWENPTATRILMAALARSASLAAMKADEATGKEWRIDAYQKLCGELMTHNHEATGSDEELWVHKALKAAADLLGVKQG